MNLTEFLLARIAEDERDANDEDRQFANTSLLPTIDSEHQARWNTERVRAECEAKRRIVEAHRRHIRADGTDYWSDEMRWPTLTTPNTERGGDREHAHGLPARPRR